MEAIKLSAKGWVIIPARYRKKYGLQPGDHVRIVDYGGVLALVPPLRHPINDAYGLLRGPTSLAQALLEERARERERER